MKVLIVGHACGPEMGSEPGLTWNWVTHLSKWHNVWVMTHPQYREKIEAYLAQYPNPNVHFVWTTLPDGLDPWDTTKGERLIRLHYILWQWEVLRRARQLHRECNFDIVHHVSWGSVSAPPALWRLPIPFVWGPVGGGMSSPSNFRAYFGGSKMQEAIRSLRLKILPYLPQLKRAVKHSSLVLSTNQETRQILLQAGAENVIPYFDNGLIEKNIPYPMPTRTPGEGLILLWAGRLEPRKALSLGLEAIAQVKASVPVRLLVAGDGPLRMQLENQAKSLQISGNVHFLGAVPFPQMAELFYRADALLFTSLRDSFGSVALEAMAYALPVITLDHQGVGELVPENAGVKVPVTTPKETIASVAKGIEYLAGHPEARLKMGENAWAFANQNTWNRRAEQMCMWYEKCVKDFHLNKASKNHALSTNI